MDIGQSHVQQAEKAIKALNPQTSERTISPAVRKQQIKTASVGAGGTQRSSTKVSDPRLAGLLDTYLQGYSPEEKQAMLDKYQ